MGLGGDGVAGAVVLGEGFDLLEVVREIHLQRSTRLGADEIFVALWTCAREVPTIDWKSAVGAVHRDNSISFLPYSVSLSSQVVSMRHLLGLGIIKAE